MQEVPFLSLLLKLLVCLWDCKICKKDVDALTLYNNCQWNKGVRAYFFYHSLCLFQIKWNIIYINIKIEVTINYYYYHCYIILQHILQHIIMTIITCITWYKIKFFFFNYSCDLNQKWVKWSKKIQG